MIVKRYVTAICFVFSVLTPSRASRLSTNFFEPFDAGHLVLSEGHYESLHRPEHVPKQPQPHKTTPNSVKNRVPVEILDINNGYDTAFGYLKPNKPYDQTVFPSLKPQVEPSRVRQQGNQRYPTSKIPHQQQMQVPYHNRQYKYRIRHSDRVNDWK